jgi:hypothetical protein
MRHASTALWVHGHEILGLQISKTRDAAKRHAAVAIRRTGCDGAAKIGVASLHVNQTALLITPQIANVVGDGLYALTFFSG